jgi:hypothetical protein
MQIQRSFLQEFQVVVTLQNCIYKHAVDLENVQRKREKLQDIKLAQTRCQKLIACSKLVVFLHVKNQPSAIGRPWR